MRGDLPRAGPSRPRPPCYIYKGSLLAPLLHSQGIASRPLLHLQGIALAPFYRHKGSIPPFTCTGSPSLPFNPARDRPLPRCVCFAGVLRQRAERLHEPRQPAQAAPRPAHVHVRRSQSRPPPSGRLWVGCWHQSDPSVGVGAGTQSGPLNTTRDGPTPPLNTTRDAPTLPLNSTRDGPRSPLNTTRDGPRSPSTQGAEQEVPHG